MCFVRSFVFLAAARGRTETALLKSPQIERGRGRRQKQTALGFGSKKMLVDFGICSVSRWYDFASELSDLFCFSLFTLELVLGREKQCSVCYV